MTVADIVAALSGYNRKCEDDHCRRAYKVSTYMKRIVRFVDSIVIENTTLLFSRYKCAS